MASTCTTTSVKKRSRKALTLHSKLEMIKLSEQGMSMAEIGRTLGLSRQTVSTIVHAKEKVLKEIKSATPLNTTVIRKRDGLIADMEKLLLVWIEDQTCHNVPLSRAIIQDKALSLFNAMKAEKGEEAAEDKFEASRGWFSRFKERGNLLNIKVQGEAASASSFFRAIKVERGEEVEDTFEIEANRGWFNRFKERSHLYHTEVLGETASADTRADAESYPHELSKIIEDGEYTMQQIFNVDETVLYWKNMMPFRTFIAEEEKPVPDLNAAQDKLTLLLGANAAGDCKLKPMMVYHCENPRALKNYAKGSLPVCYKSNSKAWMTEDLFLNWFTDYFKPTAEAYCKNNNIPFKILLLADNAPGHPRALIGMYTEINVIFLPANTTYVPQPMDQGVIAAFKAYYLRRTFAKAINTLESDVTAGPIQNKLKEFWTDFTILDSIKTIRDAWEDVEETTLKSVWSKLIPELMDDFEDFENPVEEVITNVVEMAKEFELEVEPEDVAELLVSQDEALTGDLVIQDQRKKLHEQFHPDDSPSVPREMAMKELVEAINFIETGMSTFERIDPNFERSSKVNAILINGIACYKEILKEKRRQSTTQSSLLSYFEKALPSQFSTATSGLEQPSTSIQTSVKTSSKPQPSKRMRFAEQSDGENMLSPSVFLQ